MFGCESSSWTIYVNSNGGLREIFTCSVLLVDERNCSSFSCKHFCSLLTSSSMLIALVSATCQDFSQISTTPQAVLKVPISNYKWQTNLPSLGFPHKQLLLGSKFMSHIFEFCCQRHHISPKAQLLLCKILQQRIQIWWWRNWWWWRHLLWDGHSQAQARRELFLSQSQSARRLYKSNHMNQSSSSMVLFAPRTNTEACSKHPTGKTKEGEPSFL